MLRLEAEADVLALVNVSSCFESCSSAVVFTNLIYALLSYMGQAACEHVCCQGDHVTHGYLGNVCAYIMDLTFPAVFNTIF